MQPHPDDIEDPKLTSFFKCDSDCTFDMSIDGPRLRPIAFGSRACTPMESKLHSFVGETACVRWAIAQNKKYLWGRHFYILCNCMAIQEILEYSGNIHMICRWTQELLVYSFTILHRPAKMMQDVDALSRRFGKDAAYHFHIAHNLKLRDIAARPTAYDKTNFESYSKKRTKPPARFDTPTPILTTAHRNAPSRISSSFLGPTRSF